MNDTEIKSLAEGVAHMLLSHAAHGLSTGAMDGMGEITLRDALVVAAAAAGSKTRQSWILEREELPDGWSDAAVDLIIFRKGNQHREHMVGGIELKWWRREDLGNAGNRRRDLLKDLIRAGSLYSSVDDFSFVALLSTAGSWSSTSSTGGSDKDVMANLTKSGTQKWNLEALKASSSVRNAVTALRGRVAVPNILHTELLANRTINDEDSKMVSFARVWAVRKPQRTKFLTDEDIRKSFAGGS